MKSRTLRGLSYGATLLSLFACSQLARADHSHGYRPHDVQYPILTSKPARNVAIIGAGSGGASAAYYLRKYATGSGIPTNITVFERSSYVGGRSTTVDVYDNPDEPVELGASIFVQTNRNLVDAANEFNLTTSSPSRPVSADGKGDQLGIWNGRVFVLVISNSGSWWSTAKMLWRYGWSPVRTRNLVKSTLDGFMKMYDAPHFPWRSLSHVARDVGLTGMTATTGARYLNANGVSDLFAREVIQASTRVSYAQNLGVIHGLEAMVCMATDGAMSVEGGNWQIFDGMLKAAGADVRLNTAVTELQKLEDGTYIVRSEKVSGPDAEDGGQEEEHFDTVVLAAPYQYSGIYFSPPPKHTPEQIPYVKLHVTLFASHHLLSPAAFNLPPEAPVPQTVLTTLPPDDEQNNSETNAVGPSGFWSISTLRRLHNLDHDPPQQEYLYKIFSPERINATFLSRILATALSSPAEDATAPDADLPEQDVSWIHRKTWHSYPYEKPRVAFEELQLDGRLWYTSGIEGFISTMETSSLMGMNVAKLVVDGWDGV